MQKTKYIFILLLILLGLFYFAPSGDAAGRSELFYAGAKFPSAKLAPINPPYIVYWYSHGNWDGSRAGFPDESGLYPHETAVSRYFPTASQCALWASHGKMDWATTADYNWRYWNEEQLAATCHGVSFDEFWGSIKRDQKMIDALRRIKSARPELLISAWLGPSVKFYDTIANGSDAIDIFMPEAYVGYKGTPITEIDSDIQSARAYGLTHKTVLGLYVGMKSAGPYPTPTEFEAQLKRMRSLAPEMPGVALYSVTNSHVAAYRTGYDEAIANVFWKPAPTASILSPGARTVSGSVTISAKGTPNAQTLRPIVKYRYFIDNTCVQVSSAPTYTWDTRKYSNGQHTLTVHTVDDNYLVGVAQKTVIVDQTASDTTPPNAAPTAKRSAK